MALENSRQNKNLGPSMATAPAIGVAAAAVASLLSQQALPFPSTVERSVQASAASMTSSKQPGPACHEPGSILMSKKSRIMKRMESPDDPKSCRDIYSHLNDRDLYERIMKERRRTGVGRKADPRMDNSVLACLADSRISRIDALSLSGFDFSGSNVDSHNPIDVEGVAFQQRRDQLNRRLRQAQVCFPYFAHFAMQCWRVFRYLLPLRLFLEINAGLHQGGTIR